MVKSVVREHHFSAEKIDAFFLDDTDWHGLIFWYNDVLEVNNELKSKK